ncbi:MAG TPA: M20/M25/M40 family metallo-hydrolase [Nitrososphaeraceae archaeon]|nr:M20/M25/M40 family metallo-hydrolase [Nitrososphaeraceae archaeon]
MTNPIEKIVESEVNTMILDLKTLINIPSVSAKNQSLVECAEVISTLMNRVGIHSEIIYLDPQDKNSTASKPPPIVYGEVKSKKNPNGKTILFYNHYDVQPEDPTDQWNFPPFSGEVSGNYIYGRGASDDKGELITRIKAVEYFLRETGDVPCNIKFLVEGEEEIGSINIENYLNKYKEKFSCDGIIWEFGYVNEKNVPIISLGMKGLLYIELIAFGPNKDTHSSLAVIVENPAWNLIKLLNSIRDENGKILISDWYKEVRNFDYEEEKILRSELFEEDEFKKEYGISKFLGNLSGIDVKKALCGSPTCNIAGFVSGYVEQGAKTIIPSFAKVKLDFRLVPDMEPQKQFERIQQHIKDSNITNIHVNFIHGEAAARTSSKDPFVLKVTESAKRVFGDVILNVSSAGTGPMYAFQKILKAPSISIGSTYVYSRIHSPNEFAKIDLLIKITKCIGEIIENYNDP